MKRNIENKSNFLNI